MVIFVSLHHQQCYNFRKIQQEHVKLTGTVVYMRRFTVSFPPWAPFKGMYYIEVLDPWPLDVGWSGCRCYTPGSSWKPPPSSDVLSFEAAVSSLPLSQTSSWIRSGERNLRFLETPPSLMSANNKIFSPAKRQSSEISYYFSCIMALLFTEQSVYSNSNEIITQWSLPKCLINFSMSNGRTMTSQCSQ